MLDILSDCNTVISCSEDKETRRGGDEEIIA